ncbi:MAG: rod-binding protein [Clostridiales bacterium]|nr:rod-binding protein [Clostridiales bacterium]
MGISFDPSLYGLSSSNAEALSGSLSGLNKTESTDDELMDACKQFEAYFVEQVLKGMEKTINRSEEEDNDYSNMAKDMLTQEYASVLTENTDMGIAKLLYESMKNQTGNPVSNVNTETK